MSKKKKKKHTPSQKSHHKWDDLSDFDEDDYDYGAWASSLDDDLIEDEHTSFDYEGAAEQMSRSRMDRHYGK